MPNISCLVFKEGQGFKMSNPNLDSIIHMNIKSLTHKFEIRPWLIDFIDMYFKDLEGAFSTINVKRHGQGNG